MSTESGGSVAEWTAILDHVDSMVVMTDTDGTILRLNRAAEECLGWLTAEVVGRQSPLLWHDPQEIAAYANELTRVLRSEVLPTVAVLLLGAHRRGKDQRSWTWICRGGRRMPVRLTVTSLRDHGGAISGYVMTGEIEKEQRRLRHGNVILESIAKAAPLPEIMQQIMRLAMDEGEISGCAMVIFPALGIQSRRRIWRHRSGDSPSIDLPVGANTWVDRMVARQHEGPRQIVEDLVQLGPPPTGPWRSAWMECIQTADGTVLGGLAAFRERKGAPSPDEMAAIECACRLASFAIQQHCSRRALEFSEQRHRILLEHFPAPVFVYDRETLGYLAVSDRAVEEYGYSRDEFLQMTIQDIRPAEDLPALLSMLKNAGSQFESRGLWRHRKKGGEIIDVEITTHGIDLAGRPACIVLAQNMTEKLLNETALRRSERLQESILQASLDCIVTMNAEGRIVEFNRAAEATFGYPRDQAIGKLVRDLMIPHKFREEHEQGLQRYLATGEQRIICRRIRTEALRRDGTIFPVELTVVPVDVHDERLFTAFLRDLSESQRAEQELHRTTELLQAIADGTTDAIFVKDTAGRYLLFNRAAAELTGRSSAEVLGKDDRFVFGESLGQTLMKNDREIMNRNQPANLEEELTAGGVTRSYLVMKAPLRDAGGDVVGMIGISRDITERKKMESALRASEERYRSIVEQSPDMILILRDQRVAYVNPAGIKLLGAASPNEILGQSPLAFFHPEEHERCRDQLEQLTSRECVISNLECRVVTLQQQVIDVEVQASSSHDTGVPAIQIVCRDVSARKRADRALQRHIQQTEFLAAIGLELSQSTTLAEMLRGCAEAITTHLKVAHALIWTVNFTTGRLELQAHAGPKNWLAEGILEIPLGETTVGRIAAEKIAVVGPGSKMEFGDREGFAVGQTAAFTGYPLLVEGQCLGVVATFSSDAFDSESLESLALAANGMAQNIERKNAAQLLAELNLNLEQRVIQRTLELKASEQFNRATLDALSAHVAVVDRNGVIVATNAAWRKFATGNQVAVQQVSEGANYLSVCDASAQLGDADALHAGRALRDVLAGRRVAWSHEYPCRVAGQERWFICQVTLGYINGQPHAVVAHEDVTNIKRVQQELQEAKERALQASRSKSDFLATMSHELRTPLNGILGMNELLLTTSLDDRQRNYVATCITSGHLLLQLISDILDLSKIEAGKLELDLRPNRLEPFVHEVVDMMSHVAQAKGLSLMCDVAPDARIAAKFDDTRLRQVLVNLLSNAVKFTSNGQIRVAVERISSQGTRVRLQFSVSDTGIGIPLERIDRLFKSFSQVDSSTTRQFGGTGLGLSICRQLIQLMGGEIGVASQVGVGTTFSFELALELEPTENLLPPRRLTASADNQQNRDQTQSNEAARSPANRAPLVGHVLVVEDNRINQIYITELLKHFGCTCDLAANGEEALAAVWNAPYALVLMDCQMPTMDGFMAARQIRQTEQARADGRRLPIVALTANALKGDRERCLEAGMDEYLSKPVEADKLWRMLSRFLAAR